MGAVAAWRQEGGCLRLGASRSQSQALGGRCLWGGSGVVGRGPKDGGDRTAELPRELHGSGGSMAPGGWMPAPWRGSIVRLKCGKRVSHCEAQGWMPPGTGSIVRLKCGKEVSHCNCITLRFCFCRPPHRSLFSRAGKTRFHNFLQGCFRRPMCEQFTNVCRNSRNKTIWHHFLERLCPTTHVYFCARLFPTTHLRAEPQLFLFSSNEQK